MNRKFLSDLFSVVTSNSIALIGSIVTGFIVPMLLGVEEYGIYKLFTLYISYAVLLHFGFVDGILLNYAGTDYKQLNKEKFRAFSKFFILFQLLIAGIIVLVIHSISVSMPFIASPRQMRRPTFGYFSIKAEILFLV